MPICPKCGATVPEGAIACGNCGTELNLAQTSPASFQSISTNSTTWRARETSLLSARLDKALRRTELLSYAVIGLAAAILVIIIILSF
ncbi:MAG TPA: zinc-ribbon domain-containing protein [Candidatus Acidoferrum sp.]|nr:zinc-ribbon domain-containing protein [Candidatus Acidoferrum sp.]